MTVDLIWNIIFPNIRILEGERCGVLMGDFKGYSTYVVKKIQQASKLATIIILI